MILTPQDMTNPTQSAEALKPYAHTPWQTGCWQAGMGGSYRGGPGAIF